MRGRRGERLAARARRASPGERSRCWAWAAGCPGGSDGGRFPVPDWREGATQAEKPGDGASQHAEDEVPSGAGRRRGAEGAASDDRDEAEGAASEEKEERGIIWGDRGAVCGDEGEGTDGPPTASPATHGTATSVLPDGGVGTPGTTETPGECANPRCSDLASEGEAGPARRLSTVLATWGAWLDALPCLPPPSSQRRDGSARRPRP